MGYRRGFSRGPSHEPAEKCEECGGVYAEDGHETVGEDNEYLCYRCEAHWYHEGSEFCPECGSEDIGGLPCPNDGMNMADLEESRRAAAAERKMDQMRLEGDL